jgi:predicted RNA binding protein YcfA (HicA-like mRNA interferase family)
VLSGNKLIKLLIKAGFTLTRQSGSHVIMVKTEPSGKRGVVVPKHKEIDKGTLNEIIRQAGLKKDEFIELLK